MSEAHNPYAPPKEPLEPAPDSNGVWRSGELLVVSHDVLPNTDWCIKSNEPATNQMTFSFSWHHPGWYWLAPLVGLYVLALPIVTRQITIPFGLNQKHYRRRVWRMIAGQGCLVLAVTLFLTSIYSNFIGVAAEMNEMMLRVFLLATSGCSCVLLVVGATFLALNFYELRAVRITSGHTYICGAHPDFLARFPESRSRT